MSQEYIRDGEAVKDASSCCQACQDDEECVAMQYDEGWQCALFRNKEDGECPLAFTVGKGRPGWGRYMVAAQVVEGLRRMALIPMPFEFG